MMRAVVLLFLAMSISVAAQVQKKDIAGITNYSDASTQRWDAAGVPARAAMAALKTEGFRAVINLREASAGSRYHAGRAAAKAAGLKYIHLPFNVATPDPKVVDSFLAAVADTSNQPVFIHCGSANRVGGLWMIKRVLRDGWDLQKAQTEAEAIGLRDPRLTTFATDYINKSHQHTHPERALLFPARPRCARLLRGA